MNKPILSSVSQKLAWKDLVCDIKSFIWNINKITASSSQHVC